MDTPTQEDDPAMTEYQPSPQDSVALLQRLRASVAQAYAERLEAIPHNVLTISEERVAVEDITDERCDVTMMAGVNENGAAQLTLYLAPQLGRQARYLDLTMPEVRQLTAMLTDMLTKIEEVPTCSVRPNWLPAKAD